MLYRLRIPRDIEDVRLIVQELQLAKQSYYHSVLLFYILVYLYKQTFAIPGSVFLVIVSTVFALRTFPQNIIGGAIFGPMTAVPLVCVLTATGASLCYSISYLVGGDIVKYYLQHKIEPLVFRPHPLRWVQSFFCRA